MTDPETPKPMCDLQPPMLQESPKENGFADELMVANDTPNKNPIKISVSPFLQNNVISHELKETDICDNNSTDPLDCDRENINNNCIIKSIIHLSNDSSGSHANKDGLSCLNGNKDLLKEIENNIFNDHSSLNNGSCGNSCIQILASTSSGKKLKKDKLDFSKLKDDSDLRVPKQKCLDTDSEEESPLEEYISYQDYDNNVYNTEIQDVLLQVPKSPITNLESSRRSSLKRTLDHPDDTGKAKKRRKNIQFDGVTVFYFPRSQGFNCIPSQGGSTLGMSRKHFCIKRFSLTEHAAEQKRAHKEQILQSKLQQIAAKKGNCSSSEESEDASDISDSEMEAESFLFLQPLPIRQRRSLLRQAGVRQIEVLEKEECKDIRLSREMCGCQCQIACSPETCQCAGAGIKCQVDRHNFPCGCTREGCGNESGRIEFNPIRVRTHFLQTLMRIEIEKRQSQWENVHNKKTTPSWFMNAPTTSLYHQSLNSTAALTSETSCTHTRDSTNLWVSFDQQENKNRLQPYQERENTSSEFCPTSFTDGPSELAAASCADATSQHDNSNAIIPIVQDLPFSCGREMVSSFAQLSSQKSESLVVPDQVSTDGQTEQTNNQLTTVEDEATRKSC